MNIIVAILFSLLFLILCGACGALILVRIKLPLRLYEALPASLLTGLSLILANTYLAGLWQAKLNLIAVITGLSASMLVALLIGGMPSWKILRRQAEWPWPWETSQDWPILASLGAWAMILSYAFYQIIVIGPDGLSSVVTFDLPVHMAMTQSFYQGAELPPQSPFFAGRPLVYPFAINFLSAMLMHLGLPLTMAIKAPSFMLYLIMLSLLYAFTIRLTASRRAALLAPAVLLCNGGMGWVYYLLELSLFNFNPLQTLFQGGHNYTDQPDYGLQWFNFVRYYILPQRSALLGLSLTLLIILLIMLLLADRERPRWGGWALAGALMGALPFMHTHSFMALGMFLSLWMLLNWRKSWLIFWPSAGLVALPQVLWIFAGRGEQHFLFHLLKGWSGWSTPLPSPVFWFLNAGTMLILLYFGLFSRTFSPELRRWSWASQLLFLLPNFFLFAPYVGDNLKIFVVWYLFSIPLVCLVFLKLWQKYRLLASFTLLLLMGAGSLDLLKVAITRSNRYVLFDHQALSVAEDLIKKLPLESTSFHSPIFDHFWFYTGRPSLLASPLYVASYGIRPDWREKDLKTIYQSEDCFEVSSLIRERYPELNYLVWSPYERRDFKIEKTCITSLYKQIYRQGEYEIYEVSSDG